MFSWLLEKLEKESKAIKKAPVHHAIAFALYAGFVTLLCFAWFGAALSLRKETIDAYKDRVGELNQLPKEKVGVFPLVTFSNDPNAEKVFPKETNAPALGYGTNGTLFQWDTKSQSWK
jgi:hypothetical protein